MARNVRPSPVTARGEARPVLDDRRQLAELQAYNSAVPTVLPGNKLTSPKTNRQDYRLGEGDYHPVRAASTVRVDTLGSGSNSVLTGNLSITTPFAFYQGVRFQGNITVSANSVLMLVGCEVEARVNLAVGAVTHAVACLFSAGGYLDNTGGAVGDCNATNCHKTSAILHINTTTVSCTT